MFKMIRTAFVTTSIVAAMCFAGFAGAVSAQEAPTPSPTVSPTPAVSPTPSPNASPTPNDTPTPNPTTRPTPSPQPPTAQTDTVPAEPVAAEPKAPISIYKDIRIGTPRQQVRSKLGEGVIDDDEGMFYQFDNEMVQIRLDKDKKVRLIAVTYTNNLQGAPSYASIFGTEPVPAADGKVYHMQRYTDAGYWVSYSKAAGENPTLTVTMQKL